MQKLDINLIASGGISSYETIDKLFNLNIYGAIIGKALYENVINLERLCLKIKNYFWQVNVKSII